MNLTLSNYLSGPLISSGLIYAYDYFFKEYSNNVKLTDAGVMFGSFLVSSLIKDYVIDYLISINNDSIQGKLINMIITVLMYHYSFNYFVRNSETTNVLSGETENILVASLVFLSTGYLQNPLILLLTNSKY